ncbi:unnamed protein product [Owenia fusiformis]|uniref:Uncharacterized protein n=1 Tax=Owenia fusiformis TaxID=6347 RepID=A0A8J1Y0V7_OWEFU|nr:unnamed protein product [Owenia fusiformis]
MDGEFYASGLKRGSDELLGINSSPMMMNGNGQASNLEINHDAKKAKLDKNQNGVPSRVLHFRGVPQDATEGEIVQMGLMFGRMTNLVLAKKKNQALLEMADINAATSMVNFHNQLNPKPLTIRGRTVYVQYSTHQELKTEAGSQQNAGAQAALQAANQMLVQGEDQPRTVLRQNAAAQAALQAAEALMGQAGEQPKTVLRVIIENMLYPVTVDVLKQIFSRYGQCQKIITFTKNNTFQALIQMADAIAAQTSKVSLNGQNIYNGCCQLKIDFSKLPSLNVKYNNDKSRDYTNPNLPTGEGMQFDAQTAACIGGGAAGVLASPFATSMPGLSTGQLTAISPLTAAPPTSQGMGIHGFVPGMPAGMAGMQGLQGMIPSPTQMQGLPGMQAALPMGYPGMPHAAATMGLRMPGQVGMGAGTVLLVSNLNEQKVTPDALFTLFGVYGDVHRVKIMFNKKDNALVQFADPNQAQQAMTHLDKVKVWGKQIKVAPSKHAVVSMPKEGQPDAGLTKDYVNSPLHRFKKPNSKNHHNIFPPSSTLHLSNIPPTVSEEEIKEAFENAGAQVTAFKFFQKDRKMALIQLGSVDEAVTALMAMHNYQLGDSVHLRVSFSKSTI